MSKPLSTRVESVKGLGRVLVACESFDVGATILVESPLLSWAAGDWAAMLKVLCASEQSTRDAVLDMFHPPLDSKDEAVVEMRDQARKLVEGEAATGSTLPTFCDLDFAHAALMAGKLNSHSANGGKDNVLYERGSKVSHSCDPNAAYSSRDVPGKLLYKAIKPISKGEQITFSYIGDLWFTPTTVRRQILQETKLFTCHCPRCDGPDPLQALYHPRDREHVIVPQSTDMENGEFVENWLSSKGECDEIPEDELQRAQLLGGVASNSLQGTAGMAFVDESLEYPSDVEACLADLPRTHTTAIQGQHLIAMILQSRADDAKNAGDSREGSLWVRAAQARMSGVRAMECVAAGCKKVAECPPNVHPPVYHCAPKVLDAAREIGAAGKREAGVPDTAALVLRYIPLMHVMWPSMKKDAEVMQVVDAMEPWSSQGRTERSVCAQ